VIWVPWSEIVSWSQIENFQKDCLKMTKDLSHIKGKHQTPLLPRSHVGQDWTLEDLLPPVQKAPKTSSGEFANQISNYKLQIIKVKYQISNIKFKLSNSNIKFIKFYKLDTLTIKRINYI